MPTSYFPHAPLQGVNGTSSDIALEDGFCRSAENFLFERGMILSRPRAVAKSISFTAPRFGKSFIEGAGYYTLVSAGNALYRLDANFSATAITGAGMTMGGVDEVGMDRVNGVFLVSGNSGGILRHDPSGSTYTVIAAAPYKFLTAHLSRAVAANKFGANTLLDPRTVAWSTAGDETDWASYGAGSVVLADSPGVITGLGNIRDTIIVARSDGFHMGYPTGQSTPAFEWKLHSREAAGCRYPTTFCTYGTMCLFVAEDDVYTFNTVDVTPIGKAVRRELLAYLRRGVQFRGFVSHSYGIQSQPQYHLVPIGGEVGVPHFVYDLAEGNWSRHLYPFVPYGGWWQRVAGNQSGPILGDATAQSLHLWTEGELCESPQRLLSRTITIGPDEIDVHLTRALISYRTLEPITDCELVGRVSVGEVEREARQEFDLDGSPRWRRRWVDFRVAGQNIQADLFIPAEASLSIRLMKLEYGISGKVREG